MMAMLQMVRGHVCLVVLHGEAGLLFHVVLIFRCIKINIKVRITHLVVLVLASVVHTKIIMMERLPFLSLLALLGLTP